MHYNNVTIVMLILKKTISIMRINEKLTKINEKLPRGSYSIISERTGVRPNTVSDIFQGKSKNPDLKTLQKIIPEAKKIIQETNELLDF